jgi:signal transduction histidine kinase/NAD-dependent dihydropyrimidine dehydrogenase PreA subunit
LEGTVGVVWTIPEKCKRCYTCVRECPARAIKVEAGQATVIEERCIACGNCVRVCAQNAKAIADCIPRIRGLVEGPARVIACLAPSFPAAFHPIPPGQVISAVRALGFAEVWEVAFGAELVSRAYLRILERARQTGQRLITSSCPAIVFYIEKHMPELVPNLVPVVSPMVAVGRAIKRRHPPGTRVVFIGPCIAKKNEFRDPAVAGPIDGVLTFAELGRMLAGRDIDLASQPVSFFDGPRSHLARSYPISGGLMRSVGLTQDILENDILVTEGNQRALEALRAMSEDRTRARLVDLLFCEGCINGPIMLNDLGAFARKEIVAAFVNERSRHTTQRELDEAISEFGDLDLAREFHADALVLPQPGEADIQRVLEGMHKYPAENQLNCGACGYATCREKAIAVCQGLAESEMCLPYLVEELEDTCQELKRSHEDLASAQKLLVHSERLASMGQLSAGVAHELNNPLGTVLLYSHMMLRQVPGDDPRRADLEMVVSEATRCKTIVRGLLDFARQSRVNKAPVELGELFDDVARIMQPRLAGGRVRLGIELAPGLSAVMMDAAQIKQVLINLVGNGLDACGEQGEVVLRACLAGDGRWVVIEVQDDGCGIPPEHMPKLFNPFFTTKEPTRGTGLGLAIAYGVVKMHAGDISAQSKPGQGTTFRVRLPLAREGVETGT